MSTTMTVVFWTVMMLRSVHAHAVQGDELVDLDAPMIDIQPRDAPSPFKTPFWSAPKPDNNKPLQGYKKISGVEDSVIYYPEHESEGLYNHAAMIIYHKGIITVSWKNAPLSEDTPGQRVLYSQSADGKTWTNAKLLFPNMSTTTTPSAQFAGPFAILNGKLYASASPAVIADGDAQGAQFCLWPDGLDPRNCGTPDRPGTQPKGLLMLRSIEDGLGGDLGPVFWASDEPPKVYKQASELNGVKTVAEMDSETQADVKILEGKGAGDDFVPPCDVADDSGSLKCEACAGGCQMYDLPGVPKHLANERTHFMIPNANDQDVILFRAHSSTLWASVRNGTQQTDWSQVVNTSIPNDNSNLNAGMLPNKTGVFLFSNAAPAKVRDPLTISISKDGFDFSICAVAQTCTNIAEGKSTCKARQAENGNVGPSYPQGLSVVGPAPSGMQGLYVVATNNKEDVIITRIPWDKIEALQ